MKRDRPRRGTKGAKDPGLRKVALSVCEEGWSYGVGSAISTRLGPPTWERERQERQAKKRKENTPGTDQRCPRIFAGPGSAGS